MMRRAILILGVILTLALAGCGNLATSDGAPSVRSETSYKLKDGRTVICIIGSGISCDWEHAR